ncbi:MAG: penicillin acylase family protein [Pseudomonadota bacterium]
MRSAIAAASAAVLLLSACGSSSPPDGASGGGSDGRYDVTITRTTYGIPHIEARDYGSLGYGYGYAFAEDNVCVLLDDLLTIRGERARWFGRDGSYSIPAAGVTINNVDSDFFWKLMATPEVVARLREAATPDIHDATAGYAAGFSRYVRELRNGEHPGRHAACRDEGWLAEISEDDLYRRYFRLAIIASSSALSNEIATATPPLLTPGERSATPAELKAAIESGRIRREDLPFPFDRERAFGSNMYALGPEATSDGSSILFGNPHFPWAGTERLYIVHLKMPGGLDIMGASLYGVPAVLIGFNDHFAWSHTVSTAYRFTLYELIVNPLNPKQYFVDGELRDIEEVPLTIDVREDDGTLTQESRRLHRSEYGPILELLVSGIPVLGWDNTRAYTLRDANAENDRLIAQFFAWNRASSLDEFKRLHRDILGAPWVNTIATGPGQDAYYGDVTVVPNVPDELVAECSAPLLSPIVGQLVPGLPLLLGNRSECAWRDDPDAPAPGIFGPSNLPTLERADWVGNFNDSYWLTNPAEPVTGYARIIGDEETERSLRTRKGILQVLRRLDGSDGRPGDKFDLETLQEVVLSGEIHSAELARAAVLAELCPSAGIRDSSRACEALQGWDGSASLDSTGAHVWREFWREAAGATDLWSTPFSAADPVNTPRDPNTANLTVRSALANAQDAIDATGIALDAALGELQRSGVNGDIPVFGGEQFEGAFTIAASAPITADGYRVDYGNSYIQTVTWDDDGVRAEGFVTYSQSTDPASPHFNDFTQAYSQKNWYRFPFRAEQIAAEATSELRLRE